MRCCIAILLFCLLLGGCRNGDPSGGAWPLRSLGVKTLVQNADATGAFIKDPVSGNRVWVDFRKVKVNGREAVVALPLNKVIETPYDLKVEIEVISGGVHQDYSFVIAPSPPSQTAKFSVLNSPELKVFVSTGWTFFWGRWPIVKTTYVHISTPARASSPTGSDEATIILEDGGLVQRLYNVDDGISQGVKIWCASTGAEIVALEPGFFVGLKACAVEESAQKYEANEERKRFVTSSTEIASAAGYGY